MVIPGRRIGLSILTLIIALAVSFANANEHPAVPGEYIVTLEEDTFRTMSLDALTTTFQAESIEKVSRASNAYLVKRNILEKPSFAMQSLGLNNISKHVEPNYIMTINDIPNDPSFSELWGLSNMGGPNGVHGLDINVLSAWTITKGSRDVIVGVIDTGVDYKHEDLKDNMWVNEAELNGEEGVDDDENGFVDDIHGYDFVNDDGDPIDDHYHGTHVAGTIGASGDNGVGIVGVAWNVRIMALKFLSGSGGGTLVGAIRSIDYATQMGATLTNNSWGGGPFTQALFDAIERAEEAGILFVAAAGNNKKDMETAYSYPAGYDHENIISVAAVDRAGNLAGFSNYGVTKVDVGAPGVEIYSTATDQSYKSLRGTSMASPHVAGVVALMYSLDPEAEWKAVKERLLETARPIASLDGMVLTGGFLNAWGALTGIKPPPDMNNPKNWENDKISGKTKHPYEKESTQEWVFEREGASEVSVYFKRFETESRYDVVEFYDSEGNLVGTMSGNHNGRYSPRVPGSSVRVVFKSDKTVNQYGLKMTRLAYR